jgi:hypothetical protein
VRTLFNAPVASLPLVALVPDQSPLATQEVALVEVQLRVEDPPWVTALGTAVRVRVGAGVGGDTVTVVLFEADPPAPLHVKVNVVVCANAAVPCEPDVALVPLQPPDAVQADALVVDHVKVDVPPWATCAGLAASETVGAGGVALTVTAAVWDVDPPAPVQLSV